MSEPFVGEDLLLPKAPFSPEHPQGFGVPTVLEIDVQGPAFPEASSTLFPNTLGSKAEVLTTLERNPFFRI